MRKHGGTPSRRDKHVTLAAISPPGVARGRFVGGQQSGLAGSKPPPLFTREASSCSSQGRRQGEPWGASPRPSAPTYHLPTSVRGLTGICRSGVTPFPSPLGLLLIHISYFFWHLLVLLWFSSHSPMVCPPGLCPSGGLYPDKRARSHRGYINVVIIA